MIERSSSKTDHCIQVCCNLIMLWPLHLIFLVPYSIQPMDKTSKHIKSKQCGSESEKASSCSLNHQSVVTDSSESKEECITSLQRPGLNN